MRNKSKYPKNVYVLHMRLSLSSRNIMLVEQMFVKSKLRYEHICFIIEQKLR